MPWPSTGPRNEQGLYDRVRQNGIPHAFIVDTAGKIVWHGHPMDNLEQEIEKYLPKAPKEAKSKTCGCCSNKVLSARYAKAYRVVVTTGLDEKKQPVNDLKQVSLDEDKIYFYVRWNLAKREHDLMWRLYDGAGRLAGRSEYTFTPCCSGCPCTHTWHSYNLNKNVDKPGVWRFQLYLDGRRKVSKRFTVAPAPII